jgi:hypothetical protein
MGSDAVAVRPRAANWNRATCDQEDLSMDMAPRKGQPDNSPGHRSRRPAPWVTRTPNSIFPLPVLHRPIAGAEQAKERFISMRHTQGVASLCPGLLSCCPFRTILPGQKALKAQHDRHPTDAWMHPSSEHVWCPFWMLQELHGARYSRFPSRRAVPSSFRNRNRQLSPGRC